MTLLWILLGAATVLGLGRLLFARLLDAWEDEPDRWPSRWSQPPDEWEPKR
jgi:hypothetical protein